jgi:hypothetical protein
MSATAKSALVSAVCAMVLTILPLNSQAVHPAVVAAIVELGRQLSDVGNSGDPKLLFLNAVGAHCGKPKHEPEMRGTRLARYYRELLAAGKSGDADLIYERAKRLKDTLLISSMYEQCFKAMGDAAKVMSYVNQIVAAGNSGQGGPSR